MTRAVAAPRLGEKVKLPAVEAGTYLVSAFAELGLSEQLQLGGELPLSWQTIAAYSQAVEFELLDWEARLLRSMSVAYLSSKAAAADPLAAPPHA